MQIAVQLSVLIGKIARIDCPRSWPQLIPVLVEAVRVTDALCQQRALQTLYYVVKSLASRRLPPDRKVFEDVSIEYLIADCLWYDVHFVDQLLVALVVSSKLIFSTFLFGYCGCMKLLCQVPAMNCRNLC